MKTEHHSFCQVDHHQNEYEHEHYEKNETIIIESRDGGFTHRTQKVAHLVHVRMERLKEHERYREDTSERLKDYRCENLTLEHDGVYVDYARQRVTEETMEKLYALARASGVKEKINAMFSGEAMNSTENRAVLHVATRAPRSKVINVDGSNVVPDVHDVLDKIKDFSDRVRNGEWVGHTGLPLTDVSADWRSFWAVVCAHGVEDNHRTRTAREKFEVLATTIRRTWRALNGLNPERRWLYLSKTFTTAETMLNARTVRQWIIAALGKEAVSKHMVAVSTNLKLVSEFGIDPKNAFAFWDWVGGRYSVCSAVGMLPLALQYGFDTCEQFLKGAWSMDEHFATAEFEKNLPVTLGLISTWNVSFLGCDARAILPYCQALAKLAPHIQQVAMESNGKGVTIDGTPVDYPTGEIDFGEPGTNGQHSFYQLIHQGRVIPCDFIGVIKSQQSVYLKGEIVSNHDELMCNFFAQADALAVGKTPVELRAENCPDTLIPHKTFTGNRPSLSIMLPELNAYTTGQLLSLKRTPRQRTRLRGGNSFDQWGVELGKVLATRVRSTMHDKRNEGKMLDSSDGYNHSTEKMLNRYLQGKAQLKYDTPSDVFPCDLINSEECRPPSSYA